MVTGLPKNGLLFYFVMGSQAVRPLWRGNIESGCTRFFLAESSKKRFVFANKHYIQYFSHSSHILVVKQCCVCSILGLQSKEKTDWQITLMAQINHENSTTSSLEFHFAVLLNEGNNTSISTKECFY